MDNGMTPQGFAQQIAQYMKQNQRKNTNSFSAPQTAVEFLKNQQLDISVDIDFLNEKVDDGCFMILVNKTICCVRELTWQEKADIQAQAFATHGEDTFYNETFEIRNVIPKCLKWVYDINNNILQEENVSRKLTEEFAEEFWYVYQNYYELSTEDAGLLYNSAFEYFKNKSNGTTPVPAIILEVDDLTHFVSLPYDVYMNLGCIKYQKYKLILMARTHALFAQQNDIPTSVSVSTTPDSQEEFDRYGGLPKWMFPEEM